MASQRTLRYGRRGGFCPHISHLGLTVTPGNAAEVEKRIFDYYPELKDGLPVGV